MNQRSLFANLLHCYQTMYESNNAQGFEWRASDFIQNAAPEEKARFFKMRVSFVIEIFMSGCRNEECFYRKLHKMNEDRYLLPFLKKISIEIQEDKELGKTLLEKVKAKEDDKKWAELYEHIKECPPEKLAVSVRNILANVNIFDSKSSNVDRVLNEFMYDYYKRKYIKEEGVKSV